MIPKFDNILILQVSRIVIETSKSLNLTPYVFLFLFFLEVILSKAIYKVNVFYSNKKELAFWFVTHCGINTRWCFLMRYNARYREDSFKFNFKFLFLLIVLYNLWDIQIIVTLLYWFCTLSCLSIKPFFSSRNICTKFYFKRF